MNRPGRPPKFAPGAHGTSSEYCRGCRCEPCRVAHAQTQKDRRERIKQGRADFTVSAELACEHLREMSRAGVGYRAFAAVLGNAPSYYQRLRQGKMKRIRQSTEERILRVTVEAASDRATVDGGRTRRMLADLLAAGYTKTYLARELGYVKGAVIQFAKGDTQVEARTQMRVEKLHRRLIGNRVARMVELATGRRPVESYMPMTSRRIA